VLNNRVVAPIAELRRTLQPTTGSLYERAVARTFSIYFTALLARVGASPNTASVLGLASGVASCALIAFGTPTWIIAGVLLLHLYEVFDCVDGELARLMKRFSTLGLFLENYSAYTMINGYYLATGYYLLRVRDLEWPLWIAVGAVAFGRNGAPVARRVLIEVLKREVPAPAESPGVPTETKQGRRALGRLRDLVIAALPSYIDMRIALSTLVLLDAWSADGVGWLLTGGFAAAILVQVAREIGALALYALTDSIERDLHSIRGMPLRTETLAND